MKNAIALLMLLLSSLGSYSQSISYVYPNKGERGASRNLSIEGSGTHFTQSSTFIVSFKSNVDGSVFSSTESWNGSDTYISGTVDIPETATPGLYSVSVQTTNEGKLSLSNAFTVNNPPQFVQLSPSSCTNGQLVNMTITYRDAGFMSLSFTTIYLNGNNTSIVADSVTPVNDSTLIAVFKIPASNRSDLCFLYINTSSGSLVIPPVFQIFGVNPQIVSTSPNMASDGEHVDITIHSSETFFTAASSLDVRLESTTTSSNLYATSQTIVNDSVLIASFDIPLHTHACVNNVLVALDGHSVKAYDAFTINGTNPELETVSPSEVVQGATMDITISGVDLYLTGTTTPDIYFYGVSGGDILSISSPVVLNDNQVKVTITVPADAPVGVYTLQMYLDGDYYSLNEALNVLDDGIPDPELISVTPNKAQRGGTVNLTIRGAHTHFMQASWWDVVLSGDAYYRASYVTAINDTLLFCVFSLPYDAPLGIYNLSIMDFSQNYLNLAGAFTIIGSAFDPQLVSVSPAMTYPGQVLDITITGANTHFMDVSSNLDMAIYDPSSNIFVQPSVFEATSNTSIIAHFKIPDNFPLGVYNFVVVSDIDGYMELPQSVILNAVGLDEQKDVITNLYPNPVHDNLYIDTKYPIRACSIVDITGKQTVVDPNEFKQANTHLIIPIDKLGLRKGIYFMRLDSENGFDYQKFIVE